MVTIMSEILKRKITLFPKQNQVMKHLGENIKLARKRRHFTQKLISERADISPVTLRKIEKGDHTVAIGHYLKVLTALNLAEDLTKVALDDELGRKLQDAALLGQNQKRTK